MGNKTCVTTKYRTCAAQLSTGTH